MSIFLTLQSLFAEVIWSERPVWVSPPMQRVRFKKGKHVNRLWLSRELKSPPKGKVYVGLGTIDVSHVTDQPSGGRIFPMKDRTVYAKEECRDFLVHCLGLPPFSSFDPSQEVGRRFRLDLAITDMKPGYAFFRFFEPTYPTGMGDARVQVEGVLSEPDRGEELLKFVARRRSVRQLLVQHLLYWPVDMGHFLYSGSLKDTRLGIVLQRIVRDVLMELNHRLNA